MVTQLYNLERFVSIKYLIKYQRIFKPTLDRYSTHLKDLYSLANFTPICFYRACVFGKSAFQFLPLSIWRFFSR